MGNDRIVVTGADGFIGKSLCASLRKENYNVVPITQEMIGELDKNTNWKPFLKKGDIIIHLAGIAHQKAEKKEIKKVNIEGTAKLCLDARDLGAKKFIFMSSAKVSGEKSKRPLKEKDENPQDIYGWTKLEAEKKIKEICEGKNLKYVIIRSPLIYGPNVKANFYRLIKLVDRKLPLPFKTVNNKRSYIGIDNIISFIKCSIDNVKTENKTFFVSDDNDLSTPELIILIGDKLGKPLRLFNVPNFVFRVVLLIPGVRGPFSKLVEDFQLDISRAKTIGGWEPSVSVEEGIEKTIHNYKEKKV